MCSAVFCDLYWGCKNALGQGALKPAKNYTFPNLPIGALNGNAFEKQVLQNWMDSKGKSPTTVFTEITAGLDSGKFTYSTVSQRRSPHFSSDPLLISRFPSCATDWPRS
jgi:hypothetical protein